MHPIPHTIQKNDTYQFKRRVPKDVRAHPVFGGKEFVQFSLKTKDRTEAALKAAQALERFEKQVQDARAGSRPAHMVAGSRAASNSVSLSPEVITLLAKEYAREFDLKHERISDYQLKVSDEQSANPSQTFMGFAGGITFETWNQRLKELENPLNEETKFKARRKLAEVAPSLNEDHPDFERLCFAFAAAEKEAILRLVDEPVPNPRYIGDTSSASGTTNGTYRLSDALALYRRLNPDNTAMLKKLNSAERAWKDLSGNDLLQMISKGQVYEFVDLLKLVPVNATERFPKQSLKDAITLNNQREAPYPTLAMKTIKAGYLSPLQAAVNLALDRELIQTNPFLGIRIRGATETIERRRAFKLYELNHILDHPIYSGCSSRYRRNSPGNLIIKDHYYWPALIALFSGLRAEEVGNLEVSDIRLDESKHPPHIQVRGTKTAAAVRAVPLHPTLVDLGFTKYVERIRKDGHALLFPDWKVTAGKSKSSGRPIRNFNECVVDKEFFEPPYPTFHCFRQTLRSELERAAFPEGMRKVIMGHQLPDMDQHYLKLTIDDTYPLFIEAVKYDGLELEKLRRR